MKPKRLLLPMLAAVLIGAAAAATLAAASEVPGKAAHPARSITRHPHIRLQVKRRQINPALVAGVKVLPRTPQMNRKLDAVLQQLKATARDPGTNVALNALTATVGTLNPLLRYLGSIRVSGQ